jgi:hypothetical protein
VTTWWLTVTWWLTGAGTFVGGAAGVRDRDGVDMVGVLLETTTTRGLAAATCGIGGLTTTFLVFGGESIGFMVMKRDGIENPRIFPDDPRLELMFIVVDGEFIPTGVELGMFVDGMEVGAGLDMAGAGLDMPPMPMLIAVIDSKCRPSSISTESALFRAALRALGRRWCCS